MADNDNKRIHGAEAAAAGELEGGFEEDRVVGPCPSCGVNISVGSAVDPTTGLKGRVVLHAIPFCSHFGKTSAEEIMKALGY